MGSLFAQGARRSGGLRLGLDSWRSLVGRHEALGARHLRTLVTGGCQQQQQEEQLKPKPGYFNQQRADRLLSGADLLRYVPVASYSTIGGAGAGGGGGGGDGKPKQSLPTSDAAAHHRSAASGDDQQLAATAKKPGLVAQFKDLYKRYWYVLLPVHVVTSTAWMAGFYYLSASGVDVPELLRSIDVSDSIVDRFEQSKMGHLAIAYLCYKIATPVRYAVTVGGTTVSIKYLAHWGWIKPMPSQERMREMYEDKKALVKAGYAEMERKATDAIAKKSGSSSGGGDAGAGATSGRDGGADAKK